MEAKLDALMQEIVALKAQMDKQDEKLDYIVKRLDHMRDKAHAKREAEPAWPK